MLRWAYSLLPEQGVKPAQLMLGNMHLSGEGVPQNYAEAMRWYRKAAEQGFGIFAESPFNTPCWAL